MEEVVQYYIVNKELDMPAEKLAVQTAHAGARFERLQDKGEWYEDWLENHEKKIMLRGKEKKLLELEEKGYISVRDLGLTVLEPNSLTVVVLPPMPKSVAEPVVKRLQLLKTNKQVNE